MTFFGSCLALSLLAASLGTNHWITASCKRTENAEKSNGTVNFGLFEYETNLNVGYGDRYTVMNMLGESRLFLPAYIDYEGKRDSFCVNFSLSWDSLGPNELIEYASAFKMKFLRRTSFGCISVVLFILCFMYA